MGDNSIPVKKERKKGWKRSAEANLKVSLALKGIPKTEECKRKSSETKKRKYASGETKTWCDGTAGTGTVKSWSKGKTKHTDPRITWGEKTKGTSRSKLERENISLGTKKAMKEKKSGEHISEKLKRIYASGDVVPWNKGMTGVYTEEARNRMGESRRGNRNGVGNKGRSGQILSEETKRRIGEATAKRHIAQGWRIGINEKRLLDTKEVEIGHRILRSQLIRGLGFVVDGLCLENNTVFEVYESCHRFTKVRDEWRKNMIQERLGCEFEIIYDKGEH